VGVAIDTSDMVYVSEEWNRRVSVFTSQGRFVTSFGHGKLVNSRGLAVDSSRVVYVCNNGVQAF
jgi:DNA-binding beta-propeller fold protein YncE